MKVRSTHPNHPSNADPHGYIFMGKVLVGMLAAAVVCAGLLSVLL